MAKAKILKIPYNRCRFAEVETDAEGRIPLATMQSLVGGYIERYPLRGHGLDGLDLIIDEEGKLKRLTVNPPATVLSGIQSLGDGRLSMDFIAGEAFVCASDEDGYSVGLTAGQEAALRKRLAELQIRIY